MVAVVPAGVGAGNGGERTAGAYGGHARVPAYPAQYRVSEIRQPFGDARGIDQVAGHDEQG